VTNKTKKSLESVDTYKTGIAFMCDLCMGIVLRNQTAVLLTFTYYNTDFPIYWDDDDLKSFKFVRCCEKCGEPDLV